MAGQWFFLVSYTKTTNCRYLAELVFEMAFIIHRSINV